MCRYRLEPESSWTMATLFPRCRTRSWAASSAPVARSVADKRVANKLLARRRKPFAKSSRRQIGENSGKVLLLACCMQEVSVLRPPRPVRLR